MKKLLWCLALFSLIVTPFFLLQGKTEVFFSPDDRPTKKLISLINDAKKRIHAAVYMITDKTIALPLIAAKNRGVDVQIITDKVTVDSSYGKGRLLREQGVTVYVYSPKTAPKKNNATKKKNAVQTNSVPKMFNMDPLMHNKFALFDEKLLFTGSFNWTRSANQKNRENVMIVDEKEVIDKYQKEFLALKEKCCAAETKKSSIDDDKSSNIKEIYLRFFELIKRTLKLA